MSTSNLYDTLKETALEFIHSMKVDPGTYTTDKARVLACRTSDFQQTWGHNLFTSTRPEYQGSLDIDLLMSHLEEWAPKYESIRAEVRDVYVDEPRKSVVMRTSLFQMVRGAGEVVENDIVWFLQMDGAGGKVRIAEEFMDPVAGGRLKELFQTVKKEEL